MSTNQQLREGTCRLDTLVGKLLLHLQEHPDACCKINRDMLSMKDPEKSGECMPLVWLDDLAPARPGHVATIDFPHLILSEFGAGDVLEEAGFTLGTTGSGIAGMERGDAFQNTDEEAQLVARLAATIIKFDVTDDEGNSIE